MSKIFSIVIPVYNEEESIRDLVDEILFNIPTAKYNYEIIIIDDCSKDSTQLILEKLSNEFSIIYSSNKKNMGQSFSIREGVKLSNSDVIITLDGDGQNNPVDILKLFKMYSDNNNLKLVGGLRKNRKDSIIKIYSSKFANFVRQFVFNDNCEDTGCSLKVFDKKIFLSFPFFTGLHRFLPTFFKSYGHETSYISVDHRKRIKGVSKYGVLNRLFKGIIDIFRVLLIIKQIKKQ